MSSCSSEQPLATQGAWRQMIGTSASLAGRITGGLIALWIAIQLLSTAFGSDTQLGFTVAIVLIGATIAVLLLVDFLGTRPGLIVAGFISLVAFLWEQIGMRTGFPFGSYVYPLSSDGGLPGHVAGVPLLASMAWLMMVAPCWIVARFVAQWLSPTWRAITTTTMGATLVMAWDIYIDPRMVQMGFWKWAPAQTYLPGVSNVPLSNFIGWFLAAAILIWLLEQLVPTLDLVQRLGVVTLSGFVLQWTWWGSALAGVALFGQAAAAGWAWAIMGLAFAPFSYRYLKVIAAWKAARTELRAGSGTAQATEQAPAQTAQDHDEAVQPGPSS